MNTCMDNHSNTRMTTHSQKSPSTCIITTIPSTKYAPLRYMITWYEGIDYPSKSERISGPDEDTDIEEIPPNTSS